MTFFRLFILFLPLLAQASSSVEEWRALEQKRLSRSVDTRKIIQPEASGLDPRYRPESGEWFSLSSVWVPEGELQVAALEREIPRELHGELVQVKGGKKYYRLFIHPQSRGLYREFLRKYPERKEHEATASSSSRTLFVRPKNDPEKVFFAKVSLDVNMGGTSRAVRTSEVVRSVGTTQYLLGQADGRHPGFQFMPEVLGIAPKEQRRGGQIIRVIPEKVRSGESRVVPLFSLYARKGKSLIEKMAGDAGVSPERFAEERILRPFVAAWSDWAIHGAFVTEAHAQNVLLELGQDGLPSGRFYLRDAGGSLIQARSPSLKPRELSRLPAFESPLYDYFQFFDDVERTSLNTYFVGGFLHNVDKELSRLDPRYRPGRIEEKFWRIVREGIASESGLDPTQIPPRRLKHKMDEVLREAREKAYREKYRSESAALGRNLRVGVMTGAFDPPHSGHLNLAREAKRQLGLDAVIVIPSAAAHKPGASSYVRRYTMADKAFKESGMIMADPGMVRAMQSEGSFHAIQEVMSRYGEDAEFFRILGDDRLDGLVQAGVPGIPRLSYVVTKRGGPTEAPARVERIGGSPVKEINVGDEGVSSTKIREAIQAGRRPAEVSQDVWDYIREHRLYGFDPQRKRYRSCSVGFAALGR